MRKPLVAIICTTSMLTVLAAGCSDGSDDGDDTGEDRSSQTFTPEEGDGAEDAPAEDEASFENGVLTTPELKIEITRFKVINAGDPGNEYGDKPVIAFWYNTTNLSDEDVSPLDFIFHFTAYQDNNPDAENELEVGSLPDDKFLDSQMENIKKGGTVENAVAYELDDLETPVELVAIEGFDDEIGSATFELR